jgi:hypothetical protein
MRWTTDTTYNVDMDISIATAAARLGTSVHRVTRAIERLGIPTSPATTERGRPPRVLDEHGFTRLLDDLGATPLVDGYTREEMFVLAALNLDSCGFRSVREVAMASVISPTTATHVLPRLIDRGLVVTASQKELLNGRVVTVTAYHANREHPEWEALSGRIEATRLPIGKPTPPAKIVPRRFWHLFWNASPQRLPLSEHADFVASRMLLSDDSRAREWAATNLPASSIARAATVRHATDEDREWLLGLAESAAPRRI